KAPAAWPAARMARVMRWRSNARVRPSRLRTRYLPVPPVRGVPPGDPAAGVGALAEAGVGSGMGNSLSLFLAMLAARLRRGLIWVTRCGVFLFFLHNMLWFSEIVASRRREQCQQRQQG